MRFPPQISKLSLLPLTVKSVQVLKAIKRSLKEISSIVFAKALKSN